MSHENKQAIGPFYHKNIMVNKTPPISAMKEKKTQDSHLTRTICITLKDTILSHENK